MRRKLFFACMALTVVGYGIYVYAGNLEPSGAPSSTMRTLDEIYSAVAVDNPNTVLPLPEQTRVEGADMIHATIFGQKQGAIRGSCTVRGREGTIVAEAISHNVISPRDAATGLPTGHRQHKPLTITKRIDRSTPLLYTAWIQNENLTDVTLQFYLTSVSGEQRRYYRIQLVNANIAEIRVGPRDQEQITFTYQRIVWTWEDGEISTEDDWAAPIAFDPSLVPSSQKY